MTYDSSYSVPPGGFVSDSDAFTIPNFGGTVGVRYGTVTFEDTTATTLFTLPAGAVPIDIYVDVTTAFDDTTGATLDVGLAADGDYFVNDLDVSSAGVSRYGDTSVIAARMTTGTTALEEDSAVTVQYTGTDGDATEGEAVVAILYILR